MKPRVRRILAGMILTLTGVAGLRPAEKTTVTTVSARVGQAYNCGDSSMPLLKSASQFVGQDSGQLVRGEETKARSYWATGNIWARRRGTTNHQPRKRNEFH